MQVAHDPILGDNGSYVITFTDPYFYLIFPPLLELTPFQDYCHSRLAFHA